MSNDRHLDSHQDYKKNIFIGDVNNELSALKDILTMNTQWADSKE